MSKKLKIKVTNLFSDKLKNEEPKTYIKIWINNKVRIKGLEPEGIFQCTERQEEEATSIKLKPYLQGEGKRDKGKVKKFEVSENCIKHKFDKGFFWDLKVKINECHSPKKLKPENGADSDPEPGTTNIEIGESEAPQTEEPGND